MHLADTFIQSDLQVINVNSGYTFVLSVCKQTYLIYHYSEEGRILMVYLTAFFDLNRFKKKKSLSLLVNMMFCFIAAYFICRFDFCFPEPGIFTNSNNFQNFRVNFIKKIITKKETFINIMHLSILK